MLERTLIFLKPDAVARRLTGEIIARFERKGFSIVAMKMLRLSEDFVREHYAAHEGKDFYDGLVSYTLSGPVVAIVLEGKNAVCVVRAMMGQTFGCDSPPGSIRGDYALSNRFNLVHGSDSPEAAQEEIARFIDDEDMVSYPAAPTRWIYDQSGPEPI